MAMIKMTKFLCPYCGKQASYRHAPERGFKTYACKLHQCHKCGKEYRDPFIREIGLYE